MQTLAAPKPETRSLTSLQQHRPHVYRNLFIGTWICDQTGTRAHPGPDSARTVHRTHLDALRAAASIESAR